MSTCDGPLALAVGFITFIKEVVHVLSFLQHRDQAEVCLPPSGGS